MFLFVTFVKKQFLVLNCRDSNCHADNCPTIPNSGQEDSDSDGIGDACDDDIDNDGITNVNDNCPRYPNPSQLDDDDDGVGDECDNCPTIYNPSQDDSCIVVDSDGDGVSDEDDNCVDVFNPDQLDFDLDGVGDLCDDDDDDDGIADDVDDCSRVYNPEQLGCGPDSDADGTPDEFDICPNDALISSPSFTGYETILLDPEGSSQLDPYWIVLNEGRELIQSVNADPGLAIGNHNVQGKCLKYYKKGQFIIFQMSCTF